ncbi:MAG: protein kinase family protein [Rhodospirillaceae bacterium]
MANQAPATAGTASGPVVLRDRFEINPAKPLPDLSSPQATAFHCEDRRGAGRSLMALICRPDMPVRAGAMRSLKGVQAAGMLHLIEYGVVDWPPAKRRLVAVVYERPAGGRVTKGPNTKFDPIPENQVVKKVIKPLLTAMTEMSTRGVTHRAVRLDNLFWFDTTRERLCLGDCSTAPPGYDNPAAYEPPDMAQANPEGRGQGYPKDDLYALGLTVVSLLSGRDITETWSNDDVVRAKMAQSTYATFAAEGRVPLNLIEFVRGVLCDDPKERWDLEDVDLWLQGRRLTPIQPKPPKRAQRPFKFEGREIFTMPELAHAMSVKWDAAAAPILDGRLEVWLRRGLEDNEAADAVANAIRIAQAQSGDPRQSSDLTVARVLIVLDPKAPVRYREVRTTLDGFGTALACAFMQGRPLTSYAEMLSRDLPKFWVEAQGLYSPELGHYESQFKDLKANLTTPIMGAGIERCLYEINENLHCQSPLIEGEYVTEIRELLPALDRVASKVDVKIKPMDRHIAAFINVKWERDTKVQFRALNDPDPQRAAIGMLSLLAILQWRLGPPALHGLAGWLGAQLQPIVESFHGRARRRDLEREIPQIIRKGMLPELYNLLDNQEERQKDAEGFAWARAEYSAATQQLKALETGRVARDEQAEVQGRRAAAMTSMAVAIVSIAIILVMRMF